MKLLLGALSYLVAVAAVVVAGFAAMSSVERSEPQKTSATDGRATTLDARRAQALAETRLDPNRVPVWIVPTPKYDYTAVPVEARPRTSQAIGEAARGTRPQGLSNRDRRNGVDAINAALGEQRRTAGPSLGFAPARRDNDPFYRD